MKFLPALSNISVTGLPFPSSVIEKASRESLERFPQSVVRSHEGFLADYN